MAEQTELFFLDLTVTEGLLPPFSDILLLLNNLNRLYEFIRIAKGERHAPPSLDRVTTRQTHRRIKPQERLFVSRITQTSPLKVLLLLGGSHSAAKALNIFIETVERIYNLPQSHRPKVLREQFQGAGARGSRQTFREMIEFENAITAPEAREMFVSIQKKLMSGRLTIKRAEARSTGTEEIEAAVLFQQTSPSKKKK